MTSHPHKGEGGEARRKRAAAPASHPSALSEPSAVRILCDEIGFPFDRRMKDDRVLAAFVAELVDEVGEQMHIAETIKEFTGKPPSEAAASALALAARMVAPGIGAAERIRVAAEIHDLSHATNPDDGPCDHAVDMLSSCASAIRFGMEKSSGLKSRHAAAAAQHVWRIVYGVSRHDRQTAHWEKDWARSKLISALIALSAEGSESPRERSSASADAS